MRIGLFTPIFQVLSLDGLMRELKRYPSIEYLELGAGGWPGHSHLDRAALLNDPGVAWTLRSKLADAGLSISALSCHGNPVHPDPEIARRDDAPAETTACFARRSTLQSAWRCRW